MVRKCACRGCPNRQKQPRRSKNALPTPTNERIHFYSFPVNDPERVKLWLLCVQRDVDLPLQLARLLTLCSEHFSPDDFRLGLGKIRPKLKKTAVPSLCLPHTKETPNYPLQLSQEIKSEGPAPVQGAESESQAAATPTSLLPEAAENEGNREEFVTTFVARVPQSTPLKSYDRQRSVGEAKDSVSKLRLVLSTPESPKDPSRPSKSATYYAMPVIKSFPSGNSGKNRLDGEGDTIARPSKTRNSLKKITTKVLEDVTASCDEDLDFCDLDSVASSVDSTAEEMFIDGLDPVLDGPSHDIYTPEEDCDSEPSHDIYTPEEDCDLEARPQQRKRSRLSCTSSTVSRNGRESENYGSSVISNEKWHSSDDADIKPTHLDFTPVQEPGAQILSNRCTSPLQYFQLLFPKKMWQTIVDHTNDYGAKCQGRKGKVWEYICQKDFKSYIALVIYMGMFRCSSLTDYWSESEHFSLSFPAKIMSYKKFLSISKALHLSDKKEDEKNSFRKGTTGYERLGKIQPLYQVIREACKTFFHPFQNITIIERMVASQEKPVLKRSVKNKSPNMGYKLFALTDCTCGYTWDFFIYEGKSCASQNVGLSYESVMALVDENMLGSGYKLFVDKFYTSPTLFRDLLYKKIWACGPIWANRKGFPKTVVDRLSKNAPRGTMRWIRDDSLLFVEWKDSQEVQMCSTFHKAYEGDTVQRKVKGNAHRTLVEVPIPAVVLDYNRNVGTLEPSSFITGHYRVLHKPKKWYQCVFYHLLDIAVENAFILHKLVAKRKKQKTLTRKKFLEMLVLELTEMNAENESDSASVSSAHPVSPVSSSPSAPVSASPSSPELSFPEGTHRPKHFMPDSALGRRKCKLCHLKTPVMCVTCEVPLCFQPRRDCFNQWHEFKVYVHDGFQFESM
ncbi:piggyBac transposable element-derived protein 4 isoform X3 [Carassius auratus]|uniref:PiggyBac transposable element-derived protein 4 isoform X3 n=1 Tax=Carassius auratus TaxID=7957 RepID=A0A6P6PSW7_CARAU|nr:piggyBac transposable element-derived protein 4-like isoform X3 [Carassius auratus]